MLEVFVLVFRENRWRKRAEPFPMLNPSVQNILHIGQAGMCDDRTIAQGSRPPLHAALKPAHHVARRDLFGHRGQEWLAVKPAIFQAGLFQIRFDEASENSGPK